MSDDPFSVLGLDPDSTPEQIHAARRDLARIHHPDAGGDVEQMQRVNVAARDALAARTVGAAAVADPPVRRQNAATDWLGGVRDVPSFTIEALPAQAFEALLLAGSELGDLADDDPPYALSVLMAAPVACWCQLDVVPDAGASTVSISIAPADDRALPGLLDVRNAWVDAVNGLDWDTL